jgi:hypothetical protein
MGRNMMEERRNFLPLWEISKKKRWKDRQSKR